MKRSIAVLLTCHNRREKTLASLEALFQCTLPENHKIEVFLVDDGSMDGTGEAVKNNFPQVNVIFGDGNLYWNKGMRLAWNSASTYKNFNYYLWLNDDTILDKEALIEMIKCNFEATTKDGKPAIICGACRASEYNEVFSYGGRTDIGPVIPNGKIQTCKYINGNTVLIPNQIFQVLGNLSPKYTHIFGDYDYGLSAIISGTNCYTTKNFIATCPPNDVIASWCNPQIPLKKRLKLLKSPKGLNIREYNIYNKKFKGWKWIILAIKAYLKTLFPSIYRKLST
jgi:GT2 family glycosyltransferase